MSLLFILSHLSSARRRLNQILSKNARKEELLLSPEGFNPSFGLSAVLAKPRQRGCLRNLGSASFFPYFTIFPRDFRNVSGR